MTQFLLDNTSPPKYLNVMSPREIKAFARGPERIIETFWYDEYSPRKTSLRKPDKFWIGSVFAKMGKDGWTFALSLRPQEKLAFEPFHPFSKRVIYEEVPLWCKNQQDLPESFSHKNNSLSLILRLAQDMVCSKSTENHQTGWSSIQKLQEKIQQNK